MTTGVQDDLLLGRHGEIPVRRYRAVADRSVEPRGDRLIWLHGGAFSHGDLDMGESDAVARAFAGNAYDVVAVDYRRVAPWSWWRAPAPGRMSGIRYPVPLEDVIDVVLHEGDRARATGGSLILGGASAGACLAAAATLRLVEAEGEPGPDRLLLAYGTFHAALPPLPHELRRRIRGRHSLLQFRPSTVERMNRNYAGHLEAMTDRYAFPGGHDLTGMPPTLVLDADRDSLRASGGKFAQELHDVGTAVTYEVIEDTTHGFLDRPREEYFAKGIETMARWLSELRVTDRTEEEGAD